MKGVVNQEEQQEVSYPSVLHSVFCGARGLFMDCLIKCTSAHMVVSSGYGEFVIRQPRLLDCREDLIRAQIFPQTCVDIAKNAGGDMRNES